MDEQTSTGPAEGSTPEKAAGGPRSRWRAEDTAKPAARGAADRVKRSHAQTRATLRFSLAFFAAAAVAALFADDRWLPLHLFLAGGVVTTISAVTLMLTVTWSAAPAPPDRRVAVQRACIVAGAAGVAAARSAEAPTWAIATAGAVYLIGLVLLAALITTTIRQGVERRFDVAAASYLGAVASGLAGVGIGITMATHPDTLGMRDAHATANVLGLVGLTIGGTLPFFSATVVRARMAGRATARRLAATVTWQIAMVAAMVTTLAFDRPKVAVIGFFGYAAGLAATLVWMPPPTRRQWDWAGPRLIALWLGAVWWLVAVVGTGIEALTAGDVDVAGGQAVFRGSWLLALVIAGYGQIAWGSLAYLLPVLRGGGHALLGEGFRTMKSWPGLIAVNVAGVAFVASANRIAAIAVAVWVIDGAARTVRVGTVRAARPVEDR